MNKKLLSFILCTLMLVSFTGCGFTDGVKKGINETVKNNDEFIGINSNKIKEIAVTNGNGAEIGKRAEVTYNKDKLTDESLKKFYNEKIKDSGYNYYTLVNESNSKEGIVSPGCINILSFGEIDDTGSIVKIEKDITID